MGTAYKSWLPVAIWKERTCSFCGCQYRKRLTRTKRGEGRTRAEAEEKSEAAGLKALQNEIDLSPCPTCGNFQPEMIGTLRFKRHAWAMLANLLWFLPLIVNLYWLPREAAIGATVVIALGLILFHLWTITRYPNNSAKTNQIRTAFLVRQDKVRVAAGSTKRPAEWTMPVSVRPGTALWFFFVLALGSLTLFSACDVLRRVQGWPAIPGWLPEVAGPGDWSWVELPRSVQSVKGHWTGAATATLETLDDPPVVVPLNATTRDDDWGDRIDVKRGEENTSSRLWVKIHLPNDPRLAGKTVRIRTALNVVYPTMNPGANHFDVRGEDVAHADVVQLSTPNAGAVFFFVWFASMLTPLFVVIAMQLVCLVRAQQLKQSGTSNVVQVRPRVKDDADEPSEPDRDMRPARNKDTSFEAD